MAHHYKNTSIVIGTMIIVLIIYLFGMMHGRSQIINDLIDKEIMYRDSEGNAKFDQIFEKV